MLFIVTEISLDPGDAVVNALAYRVCRGSSISGRTVYHGFSRTLGPLNSNKDVASSTGEVIDGLGALLSTLSYLRTCSLIYTEIKALQVTLTFTSHYISRYVELTEMKKAQYTVL